MSLMTSTTSQTSWGRALNKCQIKIMMTSTTSQIARGRALNKYKKIMVFYSRSVLFWKEVPSNFRSKGILLFDFVQHCK